MTGRKFLLSLLLAGVAGAAVATAAQHGGYTSGGEQEHKVAASEPALAVIMPGEEKHESAPPKPDNLAGPHYDEPSMAAPLPERVSVAGSFLASYFAQARYDWATANAYLGHVIEGDTQNKELVKRSMVLAMGSGNLELAVERARQMEALEPGNNLALLFQVIYALSVDDPDAALAKLAEMPGGDMTGFVKPLLTGWAEAGNGTIGARAYDETIMHMYHRALMALYVGDNDEAIRYADMITGSGRLSSRDLERVADVMAAAGDTERALGAYEGLGALMDGQQDDRHETLRAKIEALGSSDKDALQELLMPLNIKNPAQGAALALFDMAHILFQEDSDNSVKLFAYMALALDPDIDDARILLTDTLARNGRLEDAITHLMAIGGDYRSYLDARRHAAGLMAQNGERERALELLEHLFTDYNDIESLIQIGDIYRMDEDYNDALSAYNRAAVKIGDDIPEDYWHLLYARGMMYERKGHWNKAERDLKAAMVFRPDHPYLLNYLGYGWADQGLHLEQSLELIERAVALRPRDGYIIDSLGWVQYRMGRYKEAIPNLEKAVELLPYDAVVNDHLGDAYWKGGRRLEARFQWERALNSSDDEELSAQIEHKLRYGLDENADLAGDTKADAAGYDKNDQPLKQAHSRNNERDDQEQ